MAKAGKSTRRTRGSSPSGKSAPSDIDAFLGSLAKMLASDLDDDPAVEALERAQSIAFDAMEAGTSRKRVALAKEALAISPLCADAYWILGNEASAQEEAIAFFRQGVEKGAEALGETVFNEDAGSFWGLLETRPYMRSLQALADALVEIGAHEEAIGHYRELLRLNPNDNQGIRYSLLAVLLGLGRDKDTAALLKRYEDDGSAAWEWSRALLSFRRQGDGASSRKALAQAMSANRHVPAYLLGKLPMPQTLPAYIGMGDQDEAVAYVDDAAAAWEATAGAKAWVEAIVSQEEDPSGAITQSMGDASEAGRIEEATLALLFLGLHAVNRAWKTFDWGAMDRLHEKGLISDPASKAKSVSFTPEGLRAAKAAYETLILKGRPPK